MKRQSFLILSFLVLVGLSLTACQPSSELTSEELTAQVSLVTESPVAVIQPTATSQPTNVYIQPEQLSIFFPQELITTTIENGIINTQANSIMDNNSVIDLEVRIKENSQETTIYDFLEQAYLAAPEALPDLIILPYDMMETAAQNGYILPINQDNINLFSDENTYPFVKQMAQVEGVYYGVPVVADLMTMVVRDDQQELDTWVDILYSNKVLRFPLGDERALFTFLLYESLEGDIKTSQGFIELDSTKLSQVLGFYYEGKQKGIIPSWLNDYETYDDLWTDSIDSDDNIITWYSYLANGNLNQFAAEYIPSESGSILTYADGYVICIPNKGEENYIEKIEIINGFTDPLFIANFSLALNRIPVSSSSLTYWGESKNAAVVSYLAPNAKIKPSQNILNEAGPVLKTITNQVLNNEIQIPDALTLIDEELRP